MIKGRRTARDWQGGSVAKGSFATCLCVNKRIQVRIKSLES
jgi:hypothetical protein